MLVTNQKHCSSLQNIYMYNRKLASSSFSVDILDNLHKS